MQVPGRRCWAVEGAGSYGAGLARWLRAHGQLVIEVDRPDRAARRRQGKADDLDAYAAARAVLDRARPSPDAPLQTGLLGAESLFAYRWQVSLHGDPLTDDAKSALTELIRAWQAQGAGLDVQSHSHFTGTSCPGPAAACTASFSSAMVAGGDAYVRVSAVALSDR